MYLYLQRKVKFKSKAKAIQIITNVLKSCDMKSYTPKDGAKTFLAKYDLAKLQKSNTYVRFTYCYGINYRNVTTYSLAAICN